MTTLRKEIRIRAPKEDVRRVFADFGGISNWASATVSSYYAAHADGARAPQGTTTSQMLRSRPRS